jgi:hypothetical protein
LEKYKYKYKYLSKYFPNRKKSMIHLQAHRPRIYWGVDSGNTVTEDLYQCVKQNFGKPSFWGRYLGKHKLRKEEVDFLHAKGIKILPIRGFPNRKYTTYDQGVQIAQEAISYAEELGIPKGKIIFGDVEHDYSVTEAWIRGFVNAFYPSGYRVGIYSDPLIGTFGHAYCQAAMKDKKVQELIIWSDRPSLGTRRPEQVHCFSPIGLPCKCLGSSFKPSVWAWQYGFNDSGVIIPPSPQAHKMDGKPSPYLSYSTICRIDTNLINEKLFLLLW